MEKVLIVSSDSLFARMLMLEFRELRVTAAVHASLTPDDFEAAQKDPYRLLVIDLDTMLPALDRILNAAVGQNIPVILFGYPDSPEMTAEKQRFYDSDMYRYVFPRPFLMNQFLYCAKELLHYSDSLPMENTEAPAMKMKQHSPVDDLYVNEEAHTVFYRKEPISLTKTEYEILLLLLRQRGAVLSRSEILSAIRDKSGKIPEPDNSNLVDVYIRYLRAKLDQTYRVTLIETVRGVGYTIRKL